MGRTYASILVPSSPRRRRPSYTKLNSLILTYLLRLMQICPGSASFMPHTSRTSPPLPSQSDKKRRFHPDCHLVIQTEVDNLLQNGFIRALKYPESLANVVVVPKKGNKWRVCVDYMDLNDACPKDSFPLPHIDQIMDASAGHDMLSFLDAFSGYHHIPMHPPPPPPPPPPPSPPPPRMQKIHLSSRPMDCTVIM